MVVICGNCNKRMEHSRSGVEVVELKENGKPYKVWFYDEYICKKCGNITYAGRGDVPYINSHEDEALKPYEVGSYPHFI